MEITLENLFQELKQLRDTYGHFDKSRLRIRSEEGGVCEDITSFSHTLDEASDYANGEDIINYFEIYVHGEVHEIHSLTDESIKLERIGDYWIWYSHGLNFSYWVSDLDGEELDAFPNKQQAKEFVESIINQ